MCSLALLGTSEGRAAERVWDQTAAKKMVAKVLEVEKAESRPWNRLPWRNLVSSAVDEARKTGKPIFLFYFFEESKGPPLEPCGLEGRLVRTHALSNSTVQSVIKSNYIPLKLKLQRGKDFPVDWPALEKTATAFKFSNSRGFAGCAVVSHDLEVEYARTGTAQLWELSESPAYDPKKLAEMLERAASRVTEERSLRAQRGISDVERKAEIQRLRRGIGHAARSESPSHLPPRGYSLELALELYRMAGTLDPSGAAPAEEPDTKDAGEGPEAAGG